MANSVSDQAMIDATAAGFVTGSLADKELAYLTTKTAVGKSRNDKAKATGKKLTVPLGVYV